MKNQKLWKIKRGDLLNRSKNWKYAETYEEARKQALDANIEVQHKVVK